MIEEAGEGVVVYLRQEGRGIGLINKLRAYSLQDTGLDTVEANERLGFPADLRNYGVGAQILSDLGVHRLRLITNNPRKIAGLGGYGLRVEDRVPLVMDPGAHNAAYLAAKRSKLGHLMGDGPSCPIGGPSVVLAWHGQMGEQELAERRQALQTWALEQALRMEAEPEVRLLALLNSPQHTVLLSGLEHEDGSSAAVEQAIAQLARWPGTERLSLMLAPAMEQSSHPRADLEPEQRPLAELQAGTGLAGLRLGAGSFLVWR
jgi:3,4-dihydroxy 2-butanone 4-phosphate synthase/GTP cyclohydrolase II